MLNTEIHRDFIELNRKALFAGALQGYRLYGRGALVVNIPEMIVFGLTPIAPVPYCPAHEIAWLIAGSARLIEEYDPDQEIAIIIICPVEGPIPYRVSVSKDRIHLIVYRDEIPLN